MKTILFQGDSITDVNRSRVDDADLGHGYALLVAASLGFEKKAAYRFLNRGISGNRIVDVYARIKADIINLKPDVVSILIGINDVWHEIENQNGVDAPKFEKIYDMLLLEVKEALPNVRLMLLEPFVLRGTATDRAFDKFKSETALRAQAVKRLAAKHGAAFIPLQDKFDAAAMQAPAEIWLHDGVHPTAIGHELIKREWLAYQFE